MSRWTKKLHDEVERLPEGMRRIGYDADSETYTFKDKDGSIWQGDSGNQYGKLHLVTKAPSKPAQKGLEPLPPLSPISLASGYSASPTSPLSKKPTPLGRSQTTRQSTRQSTRHQQPPPPYTQPTRRFTDFDQLVNKDGRKRSDQPDGGFLNQVKRSFSTRNKRSTGSASRRGTV